MKVEKSNQLAATWYVTDGEKSWHVQITNGRYSIVGSRVRHGCRESVVVSERSSPKLVDKIKSAIELQTA